ncbi:hypothetical protein NZ06_00005, partial [Enterococcus faecalis]
KTLQQNLLPYLIVDLKLCNRTKETKKLYSQLIDYHLDEKALEVQCQKLLLQFDLLSERFVEKYLDTFETMT